MQTGSNKRALNLHAFGRGLGWTLSADDLTTAITEPTDAQANALNSIAPNTTALVAQQATAGESWADTLARSIPIIATTVQQAQLLQVQVDRAKQGLPPLNASQYGVGVNVGVSDQLQTLMIWGAVALGAVYLLGGRRAAL